MLRDMNAPQGIGETAMMKREVCQPDYESLVSGVKDQIAKCNNLKNALLNYVGKQHVSGRVAEMIGELVTEERQLNARLDAYIAEQEAAGRNGK